MKVADFEKRIWELEGLRIVIRAGRDDQVDDYVYKNAANENWRISEFLKTRVESRVGGRGIAVIRGNGTIAYGNVLLNALRNSYSEK